MFKTIAILSILFLTSCIDSQPKYKLIYEFENNEQLSQQDRLSTVEVLKRRLDKFSSDFDVSLTNDRKIEVMVKTSFNENRLNLLMTNPGKLEFWELYNSDELSNFLAEANQVLIEEKEKDSIKSKSFIDFVSAMGYQHSPILFYTNVQDTTFVNLSFKNPKIRALLPLDKSYAKFIWGIPTSDGVVPLYAAKSNREDKAFVTGEQIRDARQGYNSMGRPTVSIQMDELGSKRWERMTEIAFNQQTCIAVTLNDLVYSAPGVTAGPIRGGNSEISGNFTLQEAQDLATILSVSKKIPKVKFLQSSIINE